MQSLPSCFLADTWRILAFFCHHSAKSALVVVLGCGVYGVLGVGVYLNVVVFL